jgi:hypothetical protein
MTFTLSSSSSSFLLVSWLVPPIIWASILCFVIVFDMQEKSTQELNSTLVELDICSNNSHCLNSTWLRKCSAYWSRSVCKVLYELTFCKVLYKLSFCLHFFSFPSLPLIMVIRLSQFAAYFDLDSLSKTLTRAVMADLASATLVLAFSYWLRTLTWRILGSRSSNLRWSSLI